MQPIPTPQVLDPDRILADERGDFTVHHHTREELLDEALHATCSYAQQLWHDLNAMRAYLLDSLPPDPRAPGPHPTASASPTGPDDDTGWNNWITTYAAATSVLCGPNGDSGYGLSEARREAHLRQGAATTARSEQVEPVARPAPEAAPAPPAPTTASPPRRPRAAAKAVLAIIAIRHIRQRRRGRAN